MIKVPFRVNDEVVRHNFLREVVFTALEQLSPTSGAKWGSMTPQQMVEHLIWAMEVSNGSLEAQCNLNPKLLAKTKGFLFDDTPTSHDFMNPMLKKGLPPNRFLDISKAVNELRRQTHMFHEQPEGEREALRTHPVFGPLTHQEWSRSHFKHFYHHLLQFGLIETE